MHSNMPLLHEFKAGHMGDLLHFIFAMAILQYRIIYAGVTGLWSHSHLL